MCHKEFRCIIIRIKTRDGELHHNISTHDYPPIWCVDMDLIHRFGKKESFFFRGQNCANFTICSFCHWCTNFWLKQSISMQLTNVLKEHIRGKAIKIVIILGLIMSLLAYEEQIFDESEIWNCWIVFFLSVNTDGKYWRSHEWTLFETVVLFLPSFTSITDLFSHCNAIRRCWFFFLPRNFYCCVDANLFL